MNDKSSNIAKMIGEGDIARVKSRIQEKYGFTPTDEYVIDFITFINDIVGVDLDESDSGRVDDSDEIQG